MYSYHLTQWLFFFYFYCFFGWCFESSYVSIRQRRLVNRGFMRGPFLPLYGTGAIMMLVVSMPVRGNLPLTYLAGCLGATVLEFVTGVVMEALFQVRYWDYSKKRFNYKGQICLSSTIAWGFLTILMTDLVHKPIERLVLSVPLVILEPIVVILSVYIIVDFTLSFQAAIELRDLLLHLERVRAEMERLQRRVDVVIAMADEEISRRVEEGKKEYEARKEELVELRQRLYLLGEKRLQRGFIRRFYRRQLLLDNPTMHSERFKEALEELKRMALEHIHKKEKEEIHD